MAEKMKISGSQVFWLMWFTNSVISLLGTLSPAISEAKQDAWISIIVAGLGAVLITLIATNLSLLYPKQTFIEYSQIILGKWLGKIVAISYLFQWYSITGFILVLLADFIHSYLFFKTPTYVIIIAMTALNVYVTHRGGIESIGRSSEIYGPLIIIITVMTFIFSLGNLDWHRLLPIYADSGWMSILSGSLIPLVFFEHGGDMIMLQAFMDEPKKGPSRAMWGVGIAFLVVLVGALMVLMTFGPSVSSKMWDPYFDMTRYINVMDFVQNVDVLVIIIWVLSLFIKSSFLLFITSYGTAQWLGVKNWRIMVWIAALIVDVIAMSFPNIDVSSVDYPQKILIPYVLPVNLVGIPLMMLMIGSLRKKLQAKKSQ